MLSNEIKDHVLDKEEIWFEPNLLAHTVDLYANDHPNLVFRCFHRITSHSQNRNQFEQFDKPT